MSQQLPENQDNVINDLVDQIKSIILTARKKVKVVVDNELLQTYWKVGELIVRRRK
jgi:hypothetical protein